MYKVHFTNFGYFADHRFTTQAEAEAFCRSTGFETTVYCDGQIVSCWSPLRGHWTISSYADVAFA